jgi:hypothetical protein
VKCPKCHFENQEGAMFCNECGEKLEVTCLEFGKVNPLGSKFCNECGHTFSELAETGKERGSLGKELRVMPFNGEVFFHYS